MRDFFDWICDCPEKLCYEMADYSSCDFDIVKECCGVGFEEMIFGEGKIKDLVTDNNEFDYLFNRWIGKKGKEKPYLMKVWPKTNSKKIRP